MLAPFSALVAVGDRPDGAGTVHPDVPDALARHLNQLPASGRYQSHDLVRSALRDGRFRSSGGRYLFRYRVLSASGTEIFTGVVGSLAVDDPQAPLQQELSLAPPGGARP